MLQVSHSTTFLTAFQPYPLYFVQTNWQQVVPKLNSKGRDLLVVSHQSKPMPKSIPVCASGWTTLKLSVGTAWKWLLRPFQGKAIMRSDGHIHAWWLLWQYWQLLLQNLLVCNPAHRMSADEGMQHLYFSDLNPAIKQCWEMPRQLQTSNKLASGTMHFLGMWSGSKMEQYRQLSWTVCAQTLSTINIAMVRCQLSVHWPQFFTDATFPSVLLPFCFVDGAWITYSDS